ncbi:hypothetical protein M0813_16430 [Anaeramoeba flamelloides]|uniref:BTB domain-containing protein n=1 Tax=Anaeramoeba flamelloides TaxID=1746091 RepID=A0ABQ8YZL7_9EUKA|nr:hypothetical protein M0813_16430 [Anaeramoeba flamelloides]
MTQTNTQIFYSGKRNNSINQLINQNENKCPQWTPLSKIKNANKVRKIVSGRLGDGNSNQSKNLPILIFENVTRVFGGVQGHCFFFTTKNNDLYVAGANQYGFLGNGNFSNQKSPVKVPNWKAEDILDLQTNDGYSILITKEGKTYGCGRVGFNGFTTNKSTFTEIEELKNKKVVEYFGGSKISLALTNENELFGWGFDSDNHPTDQYGNIRIQKPHKINLPEIFQNNPSIKLKITCGTQCIYLYPSSNNCLIQDFQKLFESKIFCDSKLSLNENTQIPIHKIIVESRTNLQISTIEDLLNKESFSKQEILLFLKWVYFDEITNVDLLKQIFNSLNISFPPKNTFQKDLYDLFNDEDSKDFTLLIKNDEDEDEYEEILVHKIILLTRSGLFREMFENITEESKSVKDYSRKSIESIEILIKYFYTEKIELTADHDPLLIIEELEDSIEYYQLNENSNILSQLNEIKNKL